MFKVLFLVIGIIILYKLIFDFIIPVYRASKTIRGKFREMQEQQMNQANGSRQDEATQQKANKPPRKDYIDFEEIK
jgi:hypothetical protein